MPHLSKSVIHARITRVLSAGFAFVVLTSLLAALAGIRNLQLIQANANEVVGELRLTASLIAQIQGQLNSLRAVAHHLSSDPDAIDDEDLVRMLDTAGANIARIVEGGLGTPEEDRWRALQEASRVYSQEARRLVESKNPTIQDIDELFFRRDNMIRVAAGLINLSNHRAVEAQSQVDMQTTRMIRQTLYIVGGFLVLAAVFAAVTLRTATRMIRTTEAQTRDLARVSWNLVESQEAAARRFSHELHDELGQSLTAIKANLAAMGRDGGDPAGRLGDCLALVEESINNVREMSQLLHPRMLDDFGLDTTLRSLVERLSERTGLTVHYESNLTARLPSQTATQLFRIAQEALTNVSRHSGASEVWVRLRRKDESVSLTVQDNGVGFPQTPEPRRRGLGLITMGARARNLDGEIRFGRPVSGGAMIDVEVPVRGNQDGEEDTDTAGG